MEQSHTRATQSEQIDLRKLMYALWRQKLLIVLCTIIVAGIAAAYALLSAPIYEASVQTLPPTASDLASYNAASQLTGAAVHGIIGSSSETAPPGIAAITPENAYASFLRQLTSEAVRQRFFQQYYLPIHGEPSNPASVELTWKALNNDLTITTPKSTSDSVAKLTLQGEDPRTIADWANYYVQLAATRSRQELLENLKGEVQVRKQGVADQIAALRMVAQTIRTDRITRLQNALHIAQSIGLEEPPVGTPLISVGEHGTTEADTYANGAMTYLRGAKALRAELEQLNKRESDDAYITGLPSLLKKQALLNSIDLNPTSLAVATIDREAIAPVEPVKPKKLLVLVVGVILGGMLGISLALLLYVFKED